MIAGRLNQRIDLWKRETTVNAYNEQVESYYYKAQVKADVRVRDSRQSIVASSEGLTGSIVLNVRIYQPIVVTDKIVYNGETYEVVSVIKDWENQLLSIVADWRPEKLNRNDV